MINVSISTAESGAKKVRLGKQGENGVRKIIFDLQSMVNRYGDGLATLVFQRNGDTAPYVVTATREENSLVWIVSSTDTAKAGPGRAEIRWFVDGALAKTVIFATETIASIVEDTEMPDVMQTWYDQMIDYVDAQPQIVIGEVQRMIDGKADTAAVDNVYAKKTDIPTKLSKLTNDAGFITEIPEEYVTDTELEDVRSSLSAMIGSPLVAASAAEMTDTDRVYVYTGAETGYENGDWYYYDSGIGQWRSGGVYNSTAVTTDKTLSVENSAADAKATGDAIDSINEDITNIGKSRNYASGVSYPVNLCTKDFWTGKTGIINGDSIARGIMYLDGDTPVTVEKPFGAYAFEKLGASLIQNYAVGGATLSHGSVTVQDTLRTMDKTADIVLISAGTNDWAASRTLGQIGDTTIYTFYGALYVTLTYLKDTYEGKHIFVCTPLQRGSYGAENNNGNTLEEFRDAIIEMCSQFDIPVVDMLKESHVDPLIWPDAFYDGIHPIQIGHDMMGEYLAGVMTSLANSEIVAKSDYTVKGSFANLIYETLGLYIDENSDISQREDV